MKKFAWFLLFVVAVVMASFLPGTAQYTPQPDLNVYPVTWTAGTNITSVTCATANCTLSRGTLTIVAGASATTGTVATASWAPTFSAVDCAFIQNGGATFYGVGHSVATTTGVNLTAAVSVASATFTVDYICKV